MDKGGNRHRFETNAFNSRQKDRGEGEVSKIMKKIRF